MSIIAAEVSRVVASIETAAPASGMLNLHRTPTSLGGRLGAWAWRQVG